MSSPSRNENPDLPTQPEAEPLAVDRRRFLGGLGVAALAGLGARAASAVEIGPSLGVHRRNDAYQVRHQAAVEEKNHPVVNHLCNGDEDRYPNRIASYHKTLPHDPVTGEVDPAAYDALLDALRSGRVEDFDSIPQKVGANDPLLNPVGGLAYVMDGPDSAAIGVNAPATLASAETAADAGERYWMALTRDVPFTDWNTNALVQAACDDLSDNFSGYKGPRDPVTGRVTPPVLFRADYPGVVGGPMVSQFLLRNFPYDGITVIPQIRSQVANQDFMTSWTEWLGVQDGMPVTGNLNGVLDTVARFPRNPRDLGFIASQDRVYSVYFRAGIIGLSFGRPGFDENHPYKTRTRQVGFATFGAAHLLDMIGSVGKAERHVWYHKWQVHRWLRPEAFGGLVHRVVADGASYPLHTDLLNRSTVLPRIFEYNRQRNVALNQGNQGTYLLPQQNRLGSPSHPSFPAGHAITAGACVTILKAYLDESLVFPQPRKINIDGTLFGNYVAGVDGPVLTVGGELNKLAHNLTYGRDMSGVHWRQDGLEGNLLGEALALRWLAEQRATYPEDFDGFKLTRFDGTQITI